MGQEDLGGFGDARLRRQGARLLAAMRDQPTMCVHALAEDRNEALRFGRFLDNPAVSHDEMLVQAGRLTAARVGGRHVLAIQDTTEFNFPGHTASKRGFGRSGNGRDLGLFVHPMIAVDADGGGLIGLVGAQVINRTAGKLSDRKKRPAEAKESQRWLAGAEQAGEVLAAAALITVVADRESDIYDQFARRPTNVHLLTRAAQDRALADAGRLFATIDGQPVQDHSVIMLPGQTSRPARQVRLALRFGVAALGRPATAARSLPTQVILNFVDVIEIDPPDPATALHWRLLTTHAVTMPAEAWRIVGWYRQRWTIEQVFRTLKSAAVQTEESQLTEVRRFIKLTVVGLIAAVRIVQIVLARDGGTGQGLADAIDVAAVPALHAANAKLQGRSAALHNPHDPASLAWLAWIVARLGGWSGYTSRGYKPPGPKTIARGLTRLDGILAGWNLARSADVRLP
jgi:hypothetical protein